MSVLTESAIEKLKTIARTVYDRGRMDAGQSTSSTTDGSPKAPKEKKPGLLSRLRARHQEKQKAKNAPRVTQTQKGAHVDFTKNKPTTQTSGSNVAVAFKLAAAKKAVKARSSTAAPTQKASSGTVATKPKAAPKASTTRAAAPEKKKRTTKKDLQIKSVEKLLNPPKGVSDTSRRSMKEGADAATHRKKTFRSVRNRANAAYAVQSIAMHNEAIDFNCEHITGIDEDFKFKELTNSNGKYSHSLSVHGTHKNKKDRVVVDLQRHHSDPEGHWRLNDVRKVDKDGKPVKLTYDHSHAGSIGAKGMRSVARHLNQTYGIKTVRAMRITGASAKGKDVHDMPKKTYRIGEAYAGMSISEEDSTT